MYLTFLFDLFECLTFFSFSYIKYKNFFELFFDFDFLNVLDMFFSTCFCVFFLDFFVYFFELWSMVDFLLTCFRLFCLLFTFQLNLFFDFDSCI